jgi:site-specific recombinase
MSSDIKERLREAERISPHARMPQRLRYEALKAIEALEGEAMLLRRSLGQRQEQLEAADARAERLQAEIDNIKQVEFPKRAENITRHLTARAERLRVALDKVKHLSRNQVTERMDAIFQTAAEALEEK